jgi:DNA-binding beta-propeller fold protein YncE
VAVGHGLVWVASQLASTVSGIDPRTGQVVKLARFAQGELWPGALAVSREGVWVVTAGGNEVSVFDPETMTFRRRLHVTNARTLAVAGGTAWVGLAGGKLLRIRGSKTVPVAVGIRGDGYGPSLAAAGRLWVAEGRDVLTLDVSSGAAVLYARLPRGTNAGPIALRGGLWVVDGNRRELLRLHECGQRQEAIR